MANAGQCKLYDELWTVILGHLDFKSKLHCSRVNRRLHGLLKQSTLWPDIELTFEQIVGDAARVPQDRMSPASKCVKAAQYLSAF